MTLVVGRVKNPMPVNAEIGSQNMSDSKTQSRGKKSHREPLDTSWAEALLHASPEHDGVVHPDDANLSLYQQLKTARAILSAAVEQAREALTKNPLTEMVAKEAARKAGKRGHPVVVVDDDGQVMLEIRYKGDGRENPSDEGKKSWVSELPSLEDLRERAQQAGIDISDLGRAKRKILARLDEPKPEVAPKPKMRKVAPALSTVRIVSPPVPKAPPPQGSMAALAAQGVKIASDLEDFMSSIEDIE